MALCNMDDLFNTLKDIIGTDNIASCDPHDIFNRVCDAYKSGRIDDRMKNLILLQLMYIDPSTKRKAMMIISRRRDPDPVQSICEARKSLLENHVLLDDEMVPSYGNKIKNAIFDETTFSTEDKNE